MTIPDLSAGCDHIYKYTGLSQCDSCGEPTHDIIWQEYNPIYREWFLSSQSVN